MPVVVPSTWDITGVDTCLLTKGVSLSSPGCYGNRLHSLGGQMTWDPGDLKVVCLPPRALPGVSRPRSQDRLPLLRATTCCCDC